MANYNGRLLDRKIAKKCLQKEIFGGIFLQLSRLQMITGG